MVNHRVKGLLSVLLAVILCLGLTPSVFAAEEAEGEEVFSVTLPTSLPISMDSNHNIYTSTSYIINNSTSPVEVTAVEVNEQNGWRLCRYSTDFRTRPVDAKEFGLSIQGSNVSTTGYCNIDGFSIIDAYSSEELYYDAVVAAQSDAIQDILASVVFTVSWAPVETPTETTSFMLENEAEMAEMSASVFGDGEVENTTITVENDGRSFTSNVEEPSELSENINGQVDLSEEADIQKPDSEEEFGNVASESLSENAIVEEN